MTETGGGEAFKRQCEYPLKVFIVQMYVPLEQILY